VITPGAELLLINLIKSAPMSTMMLEHLQCVACHNCYLVFTLKQSLMSFTLPLHDYRMSKTTGIHIPPYCVGLRRHVAGNAWN